MVDVCLLGCGGMMPLPGRWLTSLLVRFKGRMTLIDCGEGTQIPVKLAGWGFKAIDTICFTHFHADHVSGLPGLLLTMGNSGRTEPLALYGPGGLKNVVESLLVVAPQLPFPLVAAELPSDRIGLPADGELQISSMPVDHGMPCLAYSLAVSRPGRFDAGRAQKAGIPVTLWKDLQRGRAVTHGGSVFTPDMVLGPPRKGIKIGYCTDTRPTAGLSGFMKDCDLLVCEGMYGDDAFLQKSNEKGHMVFSQAAALARDSQSRELWLTHFSPALDSPETFLPCASGIFQNTHVGNDLMKAQFNF